MQLAYEMFIFVFCVLLFESWCYEYKNQNSFDVHIESLKFNTVTGQKTMDVKSLRVTGRNRVINGMAALLEDVGDEHFEVFGGVYSDSTNSGDFQPLPYNLTNMGPCEALEKYGQYGQPALRPGENTNFPIGGGVCPIPKDQYYFKDIVISTDNWPNNMPRGLLKAVISLSKDNVTIVGAELLFRVVDRWI